MFCGAGHYSFFVHLLSHSLRLPFYNFFSPRKPLASFLPSSLSDDNFASCLTRIWTIRKGHLQILTVLFIQLSHLYLNTWPPFLRLWMNFRECEFLPNFISPISCLLLLKRCSHTLLALLRHHNLFSFLLSIGLFPSVHKYAVISPILRKMCPSLGPTSPSKHQSCSPCQQILRRVFVFPPSSWPPFIFSWSYTHPAF